jgi:hypothetical protein
VVVAVVDMDLTNAGIVTQDTLDVMAAADQLVRTIVLHMEQVVVVVQVLLHKVTMVLAVTLVIAILQAQAADLDQTVLAVFLANHGVTVKDTDLTAVDNTEAAVADPDHLMVEALAEKAQFVSYGQLPELIQPVRTNYITNTEL